MMRVVIAPDKFKGTLTAPEAAEVIAEGWRRVRPSDEVLLRPMADGGDGTADVLGATLANAEWMSVPAVDALGGPKTGRYVVAEGTAVVELAQICGIAGLQRLDSLGAHTIGLGIVLAAARRSGADRLIIGVGGSASTDGGCGALSALGVQFVGAEGGLTPGGADLQRLERVDTQRMTPPPPGGAVVLVDVAAPLLGPTGAARVFGPQKGATPDQVEQLERGLARLAKLLGGSPEAPGAGAAGGAGYGLACWGARLVPGAPAVAELIGLPEAIARADIVITGEGRFDMTSLAGKACGYVLESAGAERSWIIAGSVDEAVHTERTISVSEVAGSDQEARHRPSHWLAAAAAEVAGRIGRNAR
jgi:glycerate kinase